jgi:hypothetical protein
MTRNRVFSVAHVTGHVAWWIFVVATLFAGGITWTGVGRYVPYIPLPRGSGWIDIPLTDSPVYIANFASSSNEQSTDLRWWSLAAFIVVLIAAVVEAISARRMAAGVVTVVTPCVALGLMLLATPGVLESVHFGTLQTLAVVLVAVAVREVWARRFAPRPS